MVDRSELLRVPAFADLPEDQIDWFLSHAEELHLKEGNASFRQGDPADAMFVIRRHDLNDMRPTPRNRAAMRTPRRCSCTS